MDSSPAKRSYHLCGVGGIGMSAVAQVLVAKGHRVSGSDRAYDAASGVPVFRQLERAGVRLCCQDGSGVTDQTDIVVVSTAIEDDNPDVGAAQRFGVSVRHRAEILAELAGQGRCLAVTGTSGKTTVTALAGWILTELGADPTVVNGGSVIEWMTERAVGNVRLGQSDLWVVEADESDRSLLRFHPEWAIITNVSKDHFELHELASMFNTFTDQTATAPVTDADLDAVLGHSEITCSARGIEFTYAGTRFSLALIGEHNVRNALQAVLMTERMGYAPGDIAAALKSFGGVHRRLENVGHARSVGVFDDYAHNPAKIAAAWKAVRVFANRVVGIWQPHGYGPLAHMYDELLDEFEGLWRAGDRVFVRPVFYAGGTADRTVSSGPFVVDLCQRGVEAEVLENDDAAMRRVVQGLGPGDVVLSMGARDPMLPDYARRLLEMLSPD